MEMEWRPLVALSGRISRNGQVGQIPNFLHLTPHLYYHLYNLLRQLRNQLVLFSYEGIPRGYLGQTDVLIISSHFSLSFKQTLVEEGIFACF